MNASETTLHDRLHALHNAIGKGQILEALEEFYDPGVEMQEGLAPPTTGLAANLEREKQWLDTVADFQNFEVKNLAVVGDTTFAETVMDYVAKNGDKVHSEQVARARWKDGKIVHERFYTAG